MLPNIAHDCNLKRHNNRVHWHSLINGNVKPWATLDKFVSTINSIRFEIYCRRRRVVRQNFKELARPWSAGISPENCLENATSSKWDFFFIANLAIISHERLCSIGTVRYLVAWLNNKLPVVHFYSLLPILMDSNVNGSASEFFFHLGLNLRQLSMF